MTSPFGSYSSCRQYLDDIDARPGAGRPGRAGDRQDPALPRPPGLRRARTRTRSGRPWRELSDVEPVRLVFTAHSIPSTMERQSGPDGGRYTAQLQRDRRRWSPPDAAPGVAWDLVWQSRSGPPQVPWLEPDINDHLAALAEAGVEGVVVSPIGFISDHLEVVWDLDTEAARNGQAAGPAFRAGGHPGQRPAVRGHGAGPDPRAPRPGGPGPARRFAGVGDTCADSSCCGPAARLRRSAQLAAPARPTAAARGPEPGQGSRGELQAATSARRQATRQRPQGGVALLRLEAVDGAARGHLRGQGQHPVQHAARANRRRARG